MAKKKAVILGPSGMIGQRFAHMLNNHPYFDVVAYCASDRSEGKKLEDVWKLSDLEIDPRLANEVIQATEASALINEGVDVAFSGLPSEVAGPIEDDLAEAGIAVFSNAASHRMEPDTPILIPEINAEHLASVEVQKRRRKKGGVIGAWKNGRFVDSPVNIMASCARVHVRDGHLEAVFIRDRAIPDAKTIAKELRSFRAQPQKLKMPSAPEQPIIVMDEPNRPQPLLDSYAGTPDRARGMATVIGRIRVTEGCLRFYLLSHNTIRGGAGGSVLNAELAFKEGVI